MKKTFYILALIATIFANAQTIKPFVSDELCPNQEYSFTASLPDNFNSLSASGGATITQYPSGTGTSISFKGKFSDVQGAGQKFTVSYRNGDSFDFKFTKIKSLFVGYKEGGKAPTKLIVPICQTTPISLNITGDQYWDASTNPYSSFGSIDNYRFLIPAGWYLNSTLSTGSNWINTSGSVIITPTTNTGGGSIIQYVAKNSCSGIFFEGPTRYISISRPNPIYTLSPTSLEFVCDVPQTKTFTVSTPSTISCSLSYTWNLGVNNGWLYNGNPAPESFSTLTNTITLTSTGNVLPSTVSVVPKLNGIPQQTSTCSTTLTPIAASGSISGKTTVCTTRIYSFTGLLPNQLITWSLSNSTAGTLSTTSGASTTITKTGGGSVELKATVRNTCGESYVKTISLFVGSPPEFGMSNDLYENQYCDMKYHQVPFLFKIPVGSSLKIHFKYPNANYTVTSLGNNEYRHTFAFSKSYSGDFNLMATITNSCGISSFETEGEYYIQSCTQTVANSIEVEDHLENKFAVFPNPAQNIVTIGLKDKESQTEKNTTISGELFDRNGQSKSKVQISDNKATFSVRELQKGIYVLKIYINDQIENHRIVVE